MVFRVTAFNGYDRPSLIAVYLRFFLGGHAIVVRVFLLCLARQTIYRADWRSRRREIRGTWHVFPIFHGFTGKKKEKKKRDTWKVFRMKYRFLDIDFRTSPSLKWKSKQTLFFISLFLISFSPTFERLNRLIEYIYIPYTYRTIFQTIFRTYNWIRPGFPLPFSVFVSVLLLRGMVESRRGVDQSFRRGRWRYRVKLADRSSHQGIYILFPTDSLFLSLSASAKFRNSFISLLLLT